MMYMILRLALSTLNVLARDGRYRLMYMKYAFKIKLHLTTLVSGFEKRAHFAQNANFGTFQFVTTQNLQEP
jgi:hypothetical protein